jgi:transposase, IS5 family
MTAKMLPRLLDPENEHDYVWADSAYSGECFEELLSLGGFESLIHEKGARNHPLSDAAKELNRVKSAIRACVEHVFGAMTMSMGGKLTRKIGLERTEAWWGPQESCFQFPSVSPMHFKPCRGCIGLDRKLAIYVAI